MHEALESHLLCCAAIFAGDIEDLLGEIAVACVLSFGCQGHGQPGAQLRIGRNQKGIVFATHGLAERKPAELAPGQGVECGDSGAAVASQRRHIEHADRHGHPVANLVINRRYVAGFDPGNRVEALWARRLLELWSSKAIGCPRQGIAADC